MLWNYAKRSARVTSRVQQKMKGFPISKTQNHFSSIETNPSILHKNHDRELMVISHFKHYDPDRS
jgi:hypothetical protein